jgi:uncharacterized protein
MGLIRFLTILFIIWLAIYFYKRLINSPGKKNRPKKTKRIETIVACHVCGLHVPQQEALERQGRYYCSAAHRDADKS